MINKKNAAFIASIFLTCSVILSGCGGSAPKQSQMQTQQDTSAKTMEQLSGIENNIEKIIKKMNGPAVETEEKQGGGSQQGQGQSQQQSTQQQSTQQQSTQQQSSQGGGSQGVQGSGPSGGQGGGQSGGQGGGQSGGQGNQGGQQAPAKPQETKAQDPWQEILGTINSMHYEWNGYTPEAIKQGASKTLLDGFETALNDLTLAVMNKSRDNTIMTANRLYSYIPDLYALNKSSVSPEIKRIRYYIRDSILNSLADNFTQAETDINNMKSSWSMLKISLPKEMQDTGGKLDFSMYELEKVVKERNKALVDIKGRVALSNISALEKAMKKSQQQQQQQQKSSKK